MLRKILGSCRPGGKTAILFTGGIDSTVLACLTQELSPELYFAEILSPCCENYNRHSIRHCRALARRLSLGFHPVPINQATFQTHLKLLQEHRRQKNFDQYLPAADHLFSLMQERGAETVLSGMGADEVLGAPGPLLKKNFLAGESASLLQHRRAAASHHLKFLAPFISPLFVSNILDIPFDRRSRKQPLTDILRKNSVIWPLMKSRPRQDSFIPDPFFRLPPSVNSLR